MEGEVCFLCVFLFYVWCFCFFNFKVVFTAVLEVILPREGLLTCRVMTGRRREISSLCDTI